MCDFGLYRPSFDMGQYLVFLGRKIQKQARSQIKWGARRNTNFSDVYIR